MADITMCEGNNCPLKETCKRYLSLVNQYSQSYYMEIPYDFEKEECDQYWKID